MKCLFTLVCSLLSGIGGSILTVLLSSRHENQISRKVAYSVVIALQRELEVGLRLIEATKEGTLPRVGPLPTNAWTYAQDLLTDRHIMEAIVRYGQKGRIADSRIGSTWGDKKFETYPVEEVLSHLKNYFCYIVPNFCDKTHDDFSTSNEVSELYVGATNVNLTLQKILNGLA